MKVKTILVSQPEPKVENSPYFDLIDRQKVKIDFVPFIHVEGVSGSGFAGNLDAGMLGGKIDLVLIEVPTTAATTIGAKAVIA